MMIVGFYFFFLSAPLPPPLLFGHIGHLFIHFFFKLVLFKFFFFIFFFFWRWVLGLNRDCRRFWVSIGSMKATGSVSTLGIHSFIQSESQ